MNNTVRIALAVAYAAVGIWALMPPPPPPPWYYEPPPSIERRYRPPPMPRIRPQDEEPVDTYRGSSLGSPSIEAPQPAALHPAEKPVEPTSVAMEPADLWAIATTKLKQLPPPEYDHPVYDPVEVIDVDTEAELRRLCGLENYFKDQIIIGCAGPKGNRIKPDRCLVYLGPIPAWTGVTRNINLRHELGHCNGWPQDHAGIR